jgi:Leucine-rich repeat (LRR) protein
MKKHWTQLKFVSPIAMLIFILLVNIDLLAQPTQKNNGLNLKEEVLTQIEKKVNNLIQTELQNLQKTENSQSVLTKSSIIKNVPVRAAVSESDSLILVNFYNATDGENWTNNTNWLTGPVSTWYGITIESDFVTEIRLKDNNLSGEIPTDLGQLISLEYLALDTNQLTGPIPTELGNLTELEYLYLNGNQLTGTIPVELFQLTTSTYCI